MPGAEIHSSHWILRGKLHRFFGSRFRTVPVNVKGTLQPGQNFRGPDALGHRLRILWLGWKVKPVTLIPIGDLVRAHERYTREQARLRAESQETTLLANPGHRESVVEASDNTEQAKHPAVHPPSQHSGYVYQSRTVEQWEARAQQKRENTRRRQVSKKPFRRARSAIPCNRAQMCPNDRRVLHSVLWADPGEATAPRCFNLLPRTRKGILPPEARCAGHGEM